MSVEAPGWRDFSSGNDDVGEQEAAVECCYNTIAPWEGGTSGTAGQLSYVKPSDQSFWATGSFASGFSQGPYPVTSGDKWRLWENLADCGLSEINATDAPLLAGRTCDIEATQSAQAGRSGHSDEKSYMLTLANVSPHFFNGSGNGVCYFGESSGAVPTLMDEPCGIKGAWSKYGSQIFQLAHCSGSNIARLRSWPIPFANNYQSVTANIFIGGVPVLGTPVPGVTDHTSVRDMHATADYLYVLANGAELANPIICKINKNSLAFIESWDITNPDFSEAGGLFVFNSTTIFILDWTNLAANSFRIGKLNTGTEVTSKICDVSGCTLMSAFHASNTVGFQYAKNSFFINDDGGKIIKVNICPFAGG